MENDKLYSYGMKLGGRLLSEVMKDLESNRLAPGEFEIVMATAIAMLLTGTASTVYSDRKYSEDVERWSNLLARITNDLFEGFTRDVSGLKIKVQAAEPLLKIQLLGET